ncbi:hypothetical protein HELRODRAFT_189312 [Helobdella robusta]|uniref:Uncharacterized protein n=1 Tax=Helobdella robusta TaxID=6412 RepID=T1FQY1_HELRO|nr:hypothetical protein HELRODRAFT_189312 [Helobdella robusta]ESN96609.1 hypothetical protein HELRODRAFT_189312 [Helobdella robusta]
MTANHNWHFKLETNPKSSSSRILCRASPNYTRSVVPLELFELYFEIDERFAVSTTQEMIKMMFHIEYNTTNVITTNTIKNQITLKIPFNSDPIYYIVPVIKTTEMINTALLSGSPTHYPLQIYAVEYSGKVYDITSKSTCESADNSVALIAESPAGMRTVLLTDKMSSGSESLNITCKYDRHIKLIKVKVWVPQFPVEIKLSDYKLGSIASWKINHDNNNNNNNNNYIINNFDKLNNNKNGNNNNNNSNNNNNNRNKTISVLSLWNVNNVTVNAYNSTTSSADSLTSSTTSSSSSSCQPKFQSSIVEVYCHFIAITPPTSLKNSNTHRLYPRNVFQTASDSNNLNNSSSSGSRSNNSNDNDDNNDGDEDDDNVNIIIGNGDDDNGVSGTDNLSSSSGSSSSNNNNNNIIIQVNKLPMFRVTHLVADKLKLLNSSIARLVKYGESVVLEGLKPGKTEIQLQTGNGRLLGLKAFRVTMEKVGIVKLAANLVTDIKVDVEDFDSINDQVGLPLARVTYSNTFDLYTLSKIFNDDDDDDDDDDDLDGDDDEDDYVSDDVGVDGKNELFNVLIEVQQPNNSGGYDANNKNNNKHSSSNNNNNINNNNNRNNKIQEKPYIIPQLILNEFFRADITKVKYFTHSFVHAKFSPTLPDRCSPSPSSSSSTTLFQSVRKVVLAQGKADFMIDSLIFDRLTNKYRERNSSSFITDDGEEEDTGGENAGFNEKRNDLSYVNKKLFNNRKSMTTNRNNNNVQLTSNNNNNNNNAYQKIRNITPLETAMFVAVVIFCVIVVGLLIHWVVGTACKRRTLKVKDSAGVGSGGVCGVENDWVWIGHKTLEKNLVQTTCLATLMPEEDFNSSMSAAGGGGGLGGCLNSGVNCGGNGICGDEPPPLPPREWKRSEKSCGDFQHQQQQMLLLSRHNRHKKKLLLQQQQQHQQQLDSENNNGSHLVQNHHLRTSDKRRTLSSAEDFRLPVPPKPARSMRLSSSSSSSNMAAKIPDAYFINNLNSKPQTSSILMKNNNFNNNNNLLNNTNSGHLINCVHGVSSTSSNNNSSSVEAKFLTDLNNYGIISSAAPTTNIINNNNNNLMTSTNDNILLMGAGGGVYSSEMHNNEMNSTNQQQQEVWLKKSSASELTASRKAQRIRRLEEAAAASGSDVDFECASMEEEKFVKYLESLKETSA